ncbi:MAG TPA: hypothetical protein PKA64_06920 [Myxococcota bacterium]|nr:hypothetical protein [Myxococcota bacterium]
MIERGSEDGPPVSCRLVSTPPPGQWTRLDPPSDIGPCEVGVEGRNELGYGAVFQGRLIAIDGARVSFEFRTWQDEPLSADHWWLVSARSATCDRLVPGPGEPGNVISQGVWDPWGQVVEGVDISAFGGAELDELTPDQDPVLLVMTAGYAAAPWRRFYAPDPIELRVDCGVTTP